VKIPKEAVLGYGGVIGGILLVGCSVAVRLIDGIVWPWGYGTGVALILVSGVRLFYWHDDQTYMRERERRARQAAAQRETE
jgi:hypothetical protein